jgi:hypothetical protein
MHLSLEGVISPVRRTFSFRKVYRARDCPASSTFEFASRDFHRLVALAIHLLYTLRLHTVISAKATTLIHAV